MSGIEHEPAQISMISTVYTFTAPITDIDRQHNIVTIDLGNSCFMRLEINFDDGDVCAKGDLATIKVEL